MRVLTQVFDGIPCVAARPQSLDGRREKHKEFRGHERTRTHTRGHEHSTHAYVHTHAQVTGTVASKAFFASLSKTFKDHKDAGRHNKFAVYINACKSGGLFDAESGAGNMLQDANTYVLASAPKKDPSSTFTPAMVKQQSFQNAVSNTAAKAKVVTSTFFANFWHNSVMRNSPLEMTHEQVTRALTHSPSHSSPFCSHR